MARNYYSEKDELRARFTIWLETTLARARSKYYSSQKQRIETISYEEMPIDYRLDPYDCFAMVGRDPNTFDFEETRLAEAFYELPLMRREVLRLLFVCELTPEEIAQRLHCSVNYVYKQKYRALKKLRRILEG